jgi:integrase
MANWSLYDDAGHRKYLSIKDRTAFIHAARKEPSEVAALCLTVAYTGCRLSEALNLTRDRVDLVEQVVILETLKKRRHGVYRAVPIPSAMSRRLSNLLRKLPPDQELLWPWCRMTGYRRIKAVMERGSIEGPYASPKGLRHAFAIAALEKSVPLNLVQKWLGHSDIATTAIYGNAVGLEEREIARRMWGRD